MDGQIVTLSHSDNNYPRPILASHAFETQRAHGVYPDNQNDRIVSVMDEGDEL
jgi:hypothetical protein